MIVEQSLDSLTFTSVDFPLVMQTLKEVIQAIQSEHPDVEQILLFGSFACGDYTPQSDIDLLFLLKESPDPYLNRPLRFLPYFSPFPFDVNLILYTHDEMEAILKERNAFLLEVLRQGVELNRV